MTTTYTTPAAEVRLNLAGQVTWLLASCCWLLAVAVGQCCPALAAAGCGGLLLDAAGCRGLRSVAAGCCWLLLGAAGG